ncbi:MAG TPA: SHOCT domain-containing protein [Pirellulales bacterium]
MAQTIRVRTSPGASLFGGVVGVIFSLIGVFVAIPTFGLFGVLWTAIAVVIAVAHFYDAFSKHGIANEVIEVSDPREGGTSPEERLRTLEDLHAKGLIRDDEYAQRRQEILRGI